MVKKNELAWARNAYEKLYEEFGSKGPFCEL